VLPPATDKILMPMLSLQESLEMVLPQGLSEMVLLQGLLEMVLLFLEITLR
jgi:hypothetical protein